MYSVLCVLMGPCLFILIGRVGMLPSVFAQTFCSLFSAYKPNTLLKLRIMSAEGNRLYSTTSLSCFTWQSWLNLRKRINYTICTFYTVRFKIVSVIFDIFILIQGSFTSQLTKDSVHTVTVYIKLQKKNPLINAKTSSIRWKQSVNVNLSISHMLIFASFQLIVLV